MKIPMKNLSNTFCLSFNVKVMVECGRLTADGWYIIQSIHFDIPDLHMARLKSLHATICINIWVYSIASVLYNESCNLFGYTHIPKIKTIHSNT